MVCRPRNQGRTGIRRRTPRSSFPNRSLPRERAFAELLIDCEGDRTLRAVLIGMLREGRQGSSR
jgi:hypothetical protein